MSSSVPSVRRRPALAAALAVVSVLPALTTLPSGGAVARALPDRPASAVAQPADGQARTHHGHDHAHDEAASSWGAGAAQPAADAADDPAGDAADFAFLSRTDPPARWDACDHVDWKASFAGAPRDGYNLVVEAVRKVEAATGLRFRYLGESTFVPTRTQRTEPGVDLSVAWAEADAPDVWSSAPAPAGSGGASWRAGDVDTAGRPVPRIATGFVVLEASRPRREDAWLDGLATAPGATDPVAEAARVLAARRQVVLHELGHALGLDHSVGSAQVMAPSATGVTEWAAGDRAGLQRLGAEAGCLGRTQEEAQARQVPPAVPGPELREWTTAVPTAPPVPVPIVEPSALPAGEPAAVPSVVPGTEPAAPPDVPGAGATAAPAAAPASDLPTVPAVAPSVAVPAPPSVAAPVATSVAPRPVRVVVRGPARARRGAVVVLTVRGRPGDAFTVHTRRAGTTTFRLARTGRLDRTGVARVSFRPTVDHRWYAAAGPARTRSAVGLTRVVR